MPAHIVLVDDDPLYREALAADLGARGYEVSGFANGPALLAALQGGITAQAALLDWSLPHMSGLDLLRILQERGFGLPVIFLTGRSGREFKQEALNAGAVDFIDKTCGTAELAQRLCRIIGG